MEAFKARAVVLALILGTASAPITIQAQGSVPIKLTVTVRGRTETLRGTGNCGHEPRASINGVPAALWIAEYESAGGQSVTLRHWQPRTAGTEEQFSLFVRSDSKRHRINTVKGSKPEGSGRSTLQATAQGGRFHITGKDQNGATLQATIECARFTGITAVGG